jgi:hypothetical protein
MASAVFSGYLRKITCTAIISALPCIHCLDFKVLGQQPADPPTLGSPIAKESDPQQFRVERVEVANGGELLTLFASLKNPQGTEQSAEELPLISVLRDTLGDERPENDKLRHLWVLTYTHPTMSQRLAGAIPFLYRKVGDRTEAPKGAPPPIMDLASTDREVWNRLFWFAIQNFALDPTGIAVRATTRTYRENLSDYKNSQIQRGLAALSLFENTSGSESPFTEHEFADLQGRMILDRKLFGGTVAESRLAHVARKESVVQKDFRGQNWELLRQRCEQEGLYFEPLEMPDGSATHAIVWVAKSDLERNRGKHYNGRFLNFKNPWSDPRLLTWKGFTETRFLDQDNRVIPETEEGARRVEMIPLALYGLDEPKIPLMLIDFRDGLNSKKREMSQRLFKDLTRNVITGSIFTSIPFYLARNTYSILLRRRGIDYNQNLRLRSYAQLKLMLSLDSPLDAGLRNELARRLERVTIDPFQNSFEAEVDLARSQYAALLAYARNPDGLAATLDRDRREELGKIKHDKKEQFWFRFLNVTTLGIYTHREKPSSDVVATLDLERSMKYHKRYLEEVLRSSPRIEITADVQAVKRSLEFITNQGSASSKETVALTAKLFSKTRDEELRSLCLSGLNKVNTAAAREALLRIYQSEKTDERWKNVSADYLKLSASNDKRIDRAAGTATSSTGQ